MPMTFTDEMVLDHGEHHIGPKPPDQSMADYREALAAHIEEKFGDKVEAMEIRTGRPWDEWTEEDKRTYLRGQLGTGFPGL